MKWPNRILLNDVVLRDGLQLEEKKLTVEEKCRIADLLFEANVTSIEFGSFVHPKAVPQMANSGELYTLLKNRKNVQLIALIPNVKGAEIARKLGVKRLNAVLSASNTHNLQNIRQTTAQSLENISEIKKVCDDHGIRLDVTVATSFGCPFEGKVSEERVQSIVANLVEKNKIQWITLADTTGVANPRQVYERMRKLVSQYGSETFNLHFHNTRGMGLANIVAGIQAGVIKYDAALGGLGGCPFAPGATGNVSTEDVVHMLHNMDIDTGIDLDKLMEAAKTLQRIVGHDLSSSVLKAGKSDRIYPIANEGGSS